MSITDQTGSAGPEKSTHDAAARLSVGGATWALMLPQSSCADAVYAELLGEGAL